MVSERTRLLYKKKRKPNATVALSSLERSVDKTYRSPNEETEASLAGAAVPGAVVVVVGVAVDDEAQVPPSLLILVVVHLSIHKGLDAVGVLQMAAGQLPVEVGGQMRLGGAEVLVVREEGGGGEEFHPVGIGGVADGGPKARRGGGEGTLGNVPVRPSVVFGGHHRGTPTSSSE